METTDEVKRAPRMKTGAVSDPVGSLAAMQAFDEGKPIEECFQAGIEAMNGQSEVIAEEAEQDVQQYEQLLKKEYFTSICNTLRADCLDFEDARKAAATLSIPTVTFSDWRKRLGV